MTSLLVYVPSSEHTWPGHPENADRMRAIMRLLDREGALVDLATVAPVAASAEQLGRVHKPNLIETVRQASLLGGGRLDADTYTTAASFEQASTAAGTVCAAVDEIMTQRASNGIALVRPPGHHAETNRVGGFCLFNNVALAARQAQVNHGVQRVLIIDFDVHHGNGTQEIFFADPTVLFMSLHLYDRFFYPGSGGLNEVGSGAGRGATVNVPFGPGAGDRAYSLILGHLIRPLAEQFKPNFVLVSAGFDAHWVDPLAAAGLSLTGYTEMAREILALANELCQGRVLFVLEGGYHPQALSYGALNLVYALTGRDEIKDPLGSAPDPEPDTVDLLAVLREQHLPK